MRTRNSGTKSRAAALVPTGLALILFSLPVAAQTNAPARAGFPVTLAGAGPIRFGTPVVADLDKNGKKWIIVGTAGNGSGGWLYVVDPRGTGAPNGGVRAGWPKQLPSEIASSPAVADLDGDGFPDIVVGCGSNIDLNLAGGVFAFRRDGSLIWQFSPRDTDGNGQPDHVWSTPALADLDGDGLADVAFGSWDHYIYALKGTTGNPLPGWPLWARDTVWSSAAVADLDGDGVPEIIIGADSNTQGPPVNMQSGGALWVLRANGSLFPGFPRFITPPDGQAPVGIQSSPAAGDIDGDGCPDIVVGTGVSTSPAEKFLYAFRRDGSTLPGWPVPLNAHGATSPALADLNGDGVLDVVMTDETGWVYAVRGNGTLLPGFPMLPKSVWGTPAVTSSGPVVAQIASSNPAILVGAVGWEVTIISKTGTQISDDGSRGGKLTYATGNSVAGPIVADLDGTGQQTIIAASQPSPGAGGPNGAVFAWNVGTPGQNSSPWPMLHRNEKRDGWSHTSPTSPSCKPAPPATRFYTVMPCRVADTRGGGLLTYGAPAYLAGEERTITVTNNVWNPCHSIPVTAKAVALNVTVTNATSAGNLRIFPAGDGAPLASTINYRAGKTRANNAVIALSFDGRGSITVRADQVVGSVDVILDVTGYFQ
ncbi:MAG TPA: VCBS repeat-containing protein [Thermoanaerobaculia bacterium]|nr:VCBS repeat-containing protein [Thermoanaerobaculia bacterium]